MYTDTGRLGLVALFVFAGGLPACGPMEGVDPTDSSSNLGPGNVYTGSYNGPAPIGDCNNLPWVCSTALPTIPLTGCSASDYTMPVMVGNQTFQLILDSGSSTLAVAASSCTGCGVSPEYTPGSTATNTGKTTSADYGGGQGWNGSVYRDSVTVASNVPAVTMAFAAITQETIQVAGASSFFSPSVCTGAEQSNGFQGIIGVAGSGAGAPNTNAYMVEMATTTTPAIFAVEMCDLNGYAWFGGYNPDFIATKPQFTPLLSDSTYYDVNLMDVQVNGASLGINSNTVGTTIVDTGTTAFILPAAQFNALIAPIERDPNFVAQFGATFMTDGNCIYERHGYTATELNTMLPTLSLVFPNVDGSSFTLTLPATESYLTPFVADDHVGYCPGLMAQPPSQGTPAMIIGNGLLHTLVTVFDRKNMQIGFAQEANCIQVGG